uniref:Uncharacterized protein n=1 Tax=Heliothis virescens TaxID=7102 RepID=A0A2A4J607_HELVI
MRCPANRLRIAKIVTTAPGTCKVASVWTPTAGKIGMTKYPNTAQRRFAQEQCSANHTASQHSALVPAGLPPPSLRIQKAVTLCKARAGVTSLAGHGVERVVALADTPNFVKHTVMGFVELLAVCVAARPRTRANLNVALSQGKDISLPWIKPQAGLRGNKRTDFLAFWLISSDGCGCGVVREKKPQGVKQKQLTRHGGFSECLYCYKCKENPSCICDPSPAEFVSRIPLQRIATATDGWKVDRLLEFAIIMAYIKRHKQT